MYAVVVTTAYVITTSTSSPDAIVAFASDVLKNPTSALVSIWVTGCMVIVIREAAYVRFIVDDDLD